MLSLILYGRNDSHGYNLHKRAAISLNTMAEMLTADDDEIIFVDYNTPDDLPTFTEAIQDTLTDRAKAKMRVLRVRSKDHQRFVGKTHLVALEPIARNVALLRSNPANRWILSTNTDMIFVPGKRSESLTDIVASLEDGIYHLPRFEIPECLWETFDRRDGRGIIDQVRHWSKRFHLNEVVYGAAHNLYDAPGDFQLALREDLFAIDAFHEEMILGWHVDSNLAKRMKLHRGEVRSALDRLTGYHCDHTRQATLMHRRDRVMNDQARFIDDVTTPQIPEQAGAWGLPDAQVEEIDLRSAISTRYIAALEKALPLGDGKLMEAWYTTEGYNDLRYDPEHVIPYLVDLLSCAALGSKIAYAGSREDTFAYLATAMAVLDPSAEVLIPSSMEWLKSRKARVVASEAWLTAAGVYVFEIGERPGSKSKPAYAIRNSAVMSLFEKFVEVEEEAQIADGLIPRRVIAVNAIHNTFDQLVSASISHTATPFSSRTRHGYVTPERLQPAVHHQQLDPKAAGGLLAARMGRTFPAPQEEMRRLLKLLADLDLHDETENAAWNVASAFAEPLLVLLADHRLAALTGRREAEIEAIAERLRRHRPSAAIGSLRNAPAMRFGRADAASRLANLEDWEDASWFRWVKRMYGGAGGYDLFKRRLWVWERATLLAELDREFSFPTRPISARPRILVVAGASEYLAACLIAAGASVDFAHPRELLEEDFTGEDWRPELHWIPMTLSEPIGRLGDVARARRRESYDAVVFTQNCVLDFGRSRFAEVMGVVNGLLKPGGAFAFAANAYLGDQADDNGIPRVLVAGGRLATGLEAATGYAPLRQWAEHLSPATADRRALNADPAEVEPFVVERNGPYTIGLWAWRKGAEATFDAEALQALLNSNPDPAPEESTPVSEDSHETSAQLPDPSKPARVCAAAAGAGRRRKNLMSGLRWPTTGAASRARMEAAERVGRDAKDEVDRLRGELQAVSMNLKALSSAIAAPLELAAAEGTQGAPLLTSHPCRQADLESDWAKTWRNELDEAPRYHRALWENLFVIRALEVNDAVREGARLLDLSPGRRFSQYLAEGGCQVEVGSLDNLDDASAGQYDACWSCAAAGHQGSIDAGAAAVMRAMDALRPGGFAVHTFDFNFGSDEETIETGGAVLFRRRDVEALAHALELRGHEVTPLDFDLGALTLDRFVDTPPFAVESTEILQNQWRDWTQRAHLKALISGHLTTSFGLIVRRRG
jgi:hypothetical protein